jgi:phage-related protein
VVHNWPEGARKEVGRGLRKVQFGMEPISWKPMPSVGEGVAELRASHDGNQYRVMYVAKFEKAIYVLHAFEKKTQKTQKRDLELARRRYNDLIKTR